MTRLERRLQNHKRWQKPKLLLKKIGRPIIGAFLLYSLVQLPATYALFRSQATTEAVSFRATSFAENLELSPGMAKTNNSPGGPQSPAFNVAQYISGQIHLDFGTYPIGNNKNFPFVLLLTGVSSRTLSLQWHFSENLAPFFESQDEPTTVAPDQQVRLDFKLDTDPTMPTGEFIGALHLSALNGFITYELPVRLRLVENNNANDNDKNKGNDNGWHHNSTPDKQALSGAVYQDMTTYTIPTVDNTISGQEPPSSDSSATDTSPAPLDDVTFSTGSDDANKNEGETNQEAPVLDDEQIKTNAHRQVNGSEQ